MFYVSVIPFPNTISDTENVEPLRFVVSLCYFLNFFISCFRCHITQFSIRMFIKILIYVAIPELSSQFFKQNSVTFIYYPGVILSLKILNFATSVNFYQ